MTLPCLSPSTWISMWRGLTMNFSMNTRSSPNEDFASDLARAKPSATSARGMRDAHALAAAAGRGLDHHRIADLFGDLHRLLVVLDDAEMARHGRDLGLGGGLLGLDLVAHRGDGLGIRPDEDDAGLGQRHRETPRARRGSRSPDAPPPRRSPGRPRRSCRSPDSSAPRPAGRSAPPRPPSRRAARRGRPRNRPRPSRCPSGARS